MCLMSSVCIYSVASHQDGEETGVSKLSTGIIYATSPFISILLHVYIDTSYRLQYNSVFAALLITVMYFLATFAPSFS